MMAFVLPPPTFFCFCLVSAVVGAISGQRATSRHGAEIEKKTWKDKIMGKEEVHWRRLKEDDQVELSHVVDACKAEPGSEPLDFSTIVEFRPCVSNPRAEVSWDYFLASVNFSEKKKEDEEGFKYTVKFKLFDRDVTDEKVKKADATCSCWKYDPYNGDRCEAKMVKKKYINSCFTKTPFELRPGFHSNVASDIKVSWNPDLDFRFDNKTDAFACDKTAGSAKSTFKMVIKAPKLVNGTKGESRPRRKTTSTTKTTTKTTTTTTSTTTKEEVEEVDRLPLEILFGDYIFVTTYKKREKMTTHYAVRGVHDGQCGRKVEEKKEKVVPNFAKVGITIGSLFIGGFVVIVIIATAYYTHQWRKSKKRRLQLSQRDLTAPMKQEEEEEEEEAVVMPREDVVLGSAPEPGEIPADAGIKAERRNVASVATSASSSTSGFAPASAPSHAPCVAFNVPENVVTIRGSGGRNKNNNNNDNKNNNVSVGSFMRGTRGADGKPSFRAFCDHPVVVGIWSILLVGNVTALIVSLALLPITHPVTNADEQGSS